MVCFKSSTLTIQRINFVCCIFIVQNPEPGISLTPSLCFKVGNQIHTLKEIIVTATSGDGDGALIVGYGGEDGELGLKILSEVHDRGDVTTAVAIIGSAPHRNNGLLREMVLLNPVSGSRQAFVGV